MFDRLFVQGLAVDPLLWSQHDPWLVALSVLVSMGASAVALHLASAARNSTRAGTRRVALATGALALGSGIWTMHYVGMLAFAVCGQARFSPWITALSVVPGLAASWVALHLLARQRMGWRLLLGGAVLVGAGIGAMHYIGMAASEFAPVMRYDAFGFALSIVVAVVLALLALWVRFGLQRLLPPAWQEQQGAITALAGVVMGLAIAGMHYTGMAALRFAQPIASLERTHSTVPIQTSLSLAIVVVTIALSMVVIAVNASLRYRSLFEHIRRIESRQRAIVETAVDGIVLINGQGMVQSLNPAAERLFGWAAPEVQGRNVSMLMPEPYRSAHDGYLARHLQTGHTAVIGRGREVQGLRKDGSVFPMRLAVGRVEQADEPLFVGFVTDLSERKALERERERDQEQLRSLVANLPGVAFRCKNEGDWPMLFISDAVLALTGWPAEDFLHGRQYFGQITHPDDARSIALDVEYALENQLPYHVQYRITTKTGQTRWLSEFGRGLTDDDGVVRWIDGVIFDITDTKARSAELEGTLAAIRRSRPTAEFDTRGRLITANALYLNLLGYTLDEAVGQPLAHFCPPEWTGSQAYEDFWDRLRTGQFERGEYHCRAKDGRDIWILGTYNPVQDADGVVVKVIKFATDLTERRAMEQDLRDARDRAEAAAAARSAFLANMSHEIRTPMNAILGFSEALLETPLTAEQRRHLDTVQQSARSLLRLLNDILDTAKLDKGAVELVLAPFHLRDLCTQVLASLSIGAEKAGLTLTLVYPPDVPTLWHGDAFRLQQVLVNLLGNAIKFTHQGGVTLEVAGHAGALQIAVQDSGIGMDDAAQERLFRPFSQADASTTRLYGGTGLGTSIARQLVELMGGSIRVHSRPGQGSRFTVQLPLATASALGTDKPAPQYAQGLRPLHILAVDDVATNLELLTLQLARQGHRVVCAASGAQALQLLAQQRFDLVLMDLHMPGMDGLQTTQQLRAWEQKHTHARTPVLALSASVLAQDRHAASASGMDGFATKPLDMAQLVQEMARVLHVPLDPPPSPRTVHGPTVIDWDRGAGLWGGHAQLRHALERFSNANAGLQETCDTLVQEAHWPALAEHAHRLRGAAGNLALPTLHGALAQLEMDAKAGQANAVRAALHAVHLAWQAVQAAIQTATGPDVAAVHNGSHGALGAAQRDAALAAIAQCTQALQRGEMPDTALHTLAALLPAPALQALHAALDAFDFPAAIEALAALRAQIDNTAP